MKKVYQFILNKINYMSRILLSLSLIAVLASCISNSDDENEEKNTNSNVPSTQYEWRLTKTEHTDANGVTMFVGYSIYDDKGNNVRYEFDDKDDDVIDSVIHYTYNDKGYNIKIEYDYDNDNIIDEAINNYYDLNGNCTKEEYDFGNDGVINDIQYLIYNSSGNLIRRESNGSPFLYYEYNSFGQKIKAEYTNDIGEIIMLNSYDYDSNGYLVSMTIDDLSGKIETNTYINDEFGNAIQIKTDYDGDGVVDRISYNSYEKIENISTWALYKFPKQIQ